MTKIRLQIREHDNETVETYKEKFNQLTLAKQL